MNLNVETQQEMTPAEIKASFPLIPTRIGKVRAVPNRFWALERELDARMEELMAPDTKEADRLKLQGECHGLAVAMSLDSPWTILDVTMAAMKRYKERHPNG